MRWPEKHTVIEQAISAGPEAIAATG